MVARAAGSGDYIIAGHDLWAYSLPPPLLCPLTPLPTTLSFHIFICFLKLLFFHMQWNHITCLPGLRLGSYVSLMVKLPPSAYCLFRRLSSTLTSASPASRWPLATSVLKSNLNLWPRPFAFHLSLSLFVSPGISRFAAPLKQISNKRNLETEAEKGASPNAL